MTTKIKDNHVCFDKHDEISETTRLSDVVNENYMYVVMGDLYSQEDNIVKGEFDINSALERRKGTYR